MRTKERTIAVIMTTMRTTVSRWGNGSKGAALFGAMIYTATLSLQVHANNLLNDDRTIAVLKPGIISAI